MGEGAVVVGWSRNHDYPTTIEFDNSELQGQDKNIHQFPFREIKRVRQRFNVNLLPFSCFQSHSSWKNPQCLLEMTVACPDSDYIKPLFLVYL